MLVKRAIAIFIDYVLLIIITWFLFKEAGFAISFVIGLIYQWFFLTRMNGQTLGKMLLGIRVVSNDGGKVGDVPAILRYIGYYLNGIFLIGWIVAVFTGRGFHDMLAGTKVVDA